MTVPPLALKDPMTDGKAKQDPWGHPQSFEVFSKEENQSKFLARILMFLNVSVFPKQK